MQIMQKRHHKVVFEMIENHENRDQNHDLKFHIIISFIVRIMCNHMLFYYEALYTDVLTVVHHVAIIIRMNNQIKKIIILFNKKYVSFITFLNNLFKQ